MNQEAVAEAFSRHAFADTYQHFAEDIRWLLVGADTIEGRTAVAAACEESAAQLAGVTATVTAFRVRGGDDFVVVDSTATYRDADGSQSRVASCDLYQFAGDRLAEIVSYAVELTAPEG